MKVVLPTIAVLTYLGILLIVAFRARGSRSYSEFSIAGRSLSLALVFGSLSATSVGPGFSIGFVGKGFETGLLFFVVGLAFALQYVLAGLFVAPRMRALPDCRTLGAVFGNKYGKSGQFIAGLVSVGLCAGFSAVMVSAGGTVVAEMLEIPEWLAMALVVVVTALYTVHGGLGASVATDALQFCIFAVTLPCVAIALMSGEQGGAARLADMVAQNGLSMSGPMKPIELSGLLLAFFLGEALIPPYANRALAARNTGVSRNGFVLAGVFSGFWFFTMVLIGIIAQGIVPEGTSEDRVLIELVTATMPGWVFALVMVILISVVMSSLDSLLNAGAIAFVEDIVSPLGKKDDQARLVWGRWATVSIAAIAAVSAAFVPSIIDGLLICYTLWAPAILPALVAGLWVKQPRALAGISSMIVGGTLALILQSGLVKIGDTPAILPALGGAILAYGVGHFVGRPRTLAQGQLK